MILCLALVTALVIGLVACNNDEDAKEIELPAYDGIVNPDYSGVTIKSDFKIGVICLHDDSSTYDKNFIEAANKAISELGLTSNNIIFKTGISETSKCKDAAEELVNAGCDVIFADSFGHESFIKEVAAAHPEVEFCHATGVMAESSGLNNFHNAFASIYEGRYLAGVAAGLKLNEMIANGTIKENEAKMGYVGAFTYAEVISGYTSFYLGAKSVCPSVTMDVQFTGSWYDLTAEKDDRRGSHRARLQTHQPTRRLHGRTVRMRTSRRSQRILQRQHVYRMPRHLHRFFQNRLDALLQIYHHSKRTRLGNR